MKRRIYLFGVSTVALATIVVGSMLYKEILIDRCLDRGGRWEYSGDYCVGPSGSNLADQEGSSW